MVAQSNGRGKIATRPNVSNRLKTAARETAVADRIEIDANELVYGVSLARLGMAVLICEGATNREVEAGIVAMTDQFCIADDGEGRLIAARWDDVKLTKIRPDPAFVASMPAETVAAFKRIAPRK